MTHRHALEAFNRTLQDLMKSVDPALEKVPFGGKVIVFGGDFRQVLPVVVKGSREDIVQACFKKSVLWNSVTVLRLSINMRLANLDCSDAEEQKEYADWILRVGEGRTGHQESDDGTTKILLPDDILLPPNATLSDLIHTIYPNLLQNVRDPDYIVRRAILCPKNEDVKFVNDTVLNAFPGDSVEYLSADTIQDADDEARQLYPTEFLNSFDASSLPPHRLVLKKSMPIILLRNLRPQEGLCNGTRLICRGFLKHVLEAEIVTGANAGEIVLIPRISLTTGETELPFRLRRTQFPVRPAFAMSINKAQGQTMDYVGIYLRNPVFTHGQLYVALSRATSRRKVYILRPDASGNTETNVVYKEILR